MLNKKQILNRAESIKKAAVAKGRSALKKCDAALKDLPETAPEDPLDRWLWRFSVGVLAVVIIVVLIILYYFDLPL